MLDGHWRVKAVISGMVWRLAGFFQTDPANFRAATPPACLIAPTTASSINISSHSMFGHRIASINLHCSHVRVVEDHASSTHGEASAASVFTAVLPANTRLSRN